MGKKKGRALSKLVRKVGPFTSVLSVVPGIGPVAAGGLGILANSAKTNRPGGGKGFSFKGLLGGTAKQFGGGAGGGPLGGLGSLFGGLFGKKAPAGAEVGGPVREGTDAGPAPGGGGPFGFLAGLFGRKKKRR